MSPVSSQSQVIQRMKSLDRHIFVVFLFVTYIPMWIFVQRLPSSLGFPAQVGGLSDIIVTQRGVGASSCCMVMPCR